MNQPSFRKENKLLNSGFKIIAGIDEVGRGAWAGPIVAGAVVLDIKKFNSNDLPVRDSKLLSHSQREKIFEQLKNKIVWSVGLASHQEIDDLGITQANILAICRAVINLSVEPDYLLLDRVNKFSHQLPFESIVDGDQKIFSVALASIMAKVYRDRLMESYHSKYPRYHFDKHKGYGTAVHKQCLNEFGVCAIHRKSYRPLKNLNISN